MFPHEIPDEVTLAGIVDNQRMPSAAAAFIGHIEVIFSSHTSINLYAAMSTVILVARLTRCQNKRA